MPVSLNETSQAVAVVPTLDPSTTARLAPKEMTPASTRAVVSAVTALLDCTTAVASAPAAKPSHRWPSRARATTGVRPTDGLQLAAEPVESVRNRTTAEIAANSPCRGLTLP